MDINLENKKSQANMDVVSLVPQNICEDITEEDRNIFFNITSFDLAEEQKQRIIQPDQTFPRQTSVVAVHWHPEFIPMDLIDQRLNNMFPNRSNELIIPTQHNEIQSYKGFSGVEVDCWSRGFNQKVQLLLHFKNENVKDAGMLKSMLAHTFKYRSSQLFEFMETITRPIENRIEAAAKQTGANSALIRFVQIYVKKIETLVNENLSQIPAQAVKNKVLRNFF